MTKKEIYQPRTRANTCCAQCKNACGGCSWSKDFSPIKGWKTRRTKNSYSSDGLKILYCPEFEAGDPLDDHEPARDGLVNLYVAIAKLAISDYKDIVKGKPSTAKLPLSAEFDCISFLGKHAETVRQQALAELAEEQNT